MKSLVKKNRSLLNPRPGASTAAPKLFFHLGEKQFSNQSEDSSNSNSIRFSDKLHERWDDFFDNFDDLRLK